MGLVYFFYGDPAEPAFVLSQVLLGAIGLYREVKCYDHTN